MSEVVLVLNELRAGQPMDASKVSRLITNHKTERDRLINLHERYKCSQTGVPIFSRTFEDKNKINSKLNNDFFSDIVDTKIGYFLGIPITYTYREPEKNEQGEPNQAEVQIKKLVDLKLSDFVRREHLPEVDAEAAKFAAICGYGARLCYIGTDGIEHIVNVYPWECIFLVDDCDIQRPEYCLRYWEELVRDGNKGTKTIYKAEFYDSTSITYYRQVSADNQTELVFTLDNEEKPNPRPHLFTECPLFGFPNNNEMLGDCEKVISLIDAYDRALSDINSELEQMRLAYMAIYGFKPDQEFMAGIKKTGAIGFDDPEGKVEFIEKNINDVVIEHNLDRLCNDIYYFAGSPNFRDEAFGGNISGVALKFKLFKLEAKCITAEREITSALSQMFKIIGEKWRIEDIDFDPDKIEYQFKRNFPLNLNDEAMTTVQLKGMVSEKTRLGLLSFVPDPEMELKEMEKDTETQIDLDRVYQEMQAEQNPINQEE